jgi:integrase
MGRRRGKGAKLEFSIGAYSLAQRDNSGAWYRVWYDLGTRRSMRVSMGTDDFEAARERLLDWYHEHHRLTSDYLNPSKVQLSSVLDDYWHHHGSKLVSAKTVEILLRHWREFWGEGCTVADVRKASRQEEFHEHLRKHGYGPNSTNRVLEIGRAAIRRAWKRGVIDSAPYILTVEPELDKPVGEPLSPAQLWAFYRGSDEEHWKDFVLLMIGTGSRPKAVVTLTKEQIDFEEGRINLNPKSRRQTNKFRPVVRLPAQLAERFRDRPDGRLLQFHGKPVGKVDHIVRIARKRAGLSERVNSYSLRHTVARWLRSQGVDTAEIACQLGHKRFGHNMTLRYMPHAPDYLERSCNALERLLAIVLSDVAPVARQKSEKAA